MEVAKQRSEVAGASWLRNQTRFLACLLRIPEFLEEKEKLGFLTARVDEDDNDDEKVVATDDMAVNRKNL